MINGKSVPGPSQGPRTRRGGVALYDNCCNSKISEAQPEGVSESVAVNRGIASCRLAEFKDLREIRVMVHPIEEGGVLAGVDGLPRNTQTGTFPCHASEFGPLRAGPQHKSQHRENMAEDSDGVKLGVGRCVGGPFTGESLVCLGNPVIVRDVFRGTYHWNKALREWHWKEGLNEEPA